MQPNKVISSFQLLPIIFFANDVMFDRRRLEELAQTKLMFESIFDKFQ